MGSILKASSPLRPLRGVRLALVVARLKSESERVREREGGREMKKRRKKVVAYW